MNSPTPGKCGPIISIIRMRRCGKRMVSKAARREPTPRGYHTGARVQAIESEETEEQNPIPILPETLARIASAEAIGTETEGTERESMNGTYTPSNSKHCGSRMVKATRNEIRA